MSNTVLGQQWRDPFALDDAGVARYKGLSREAFGAAAAHRAAGDLNSADEASRFGASYREVARHRTTRGVGRTTWRYGDMPSSRYLP